METNDLNKSNIRKNRDIARVRIARPEAKHTIKQFVFMARSFSNKRFYYTVQINLIMKTSGSSKRKGEKFFAPTERWPKQIVKFN